MHTLTRLAHPAATHAWGLPLAWYWADAAIDRPGRRTALMIGLVVAAVAATSVYLLAFVTLIIAVVAATGGRRGAPLVTIVAGVAIGVVLASPVLWPYVRFAAGGATRPIEMVAQFSASPAGYLASTSVVDARWTRPWFTNDVNVMFAGVGALAIAGLGPRRRPSDSPPAARDRARRAAPRASSCRLGRRRRSRWLYAWLWPLRVVRAARFGHCISSRSRSWPRSAWLDGAFESPCRCGSRPASCCSSAEAWQARSDRAVSASPRLLARRRRAIPCGCRGAVLSA